MVPHPQFYSETYHLASFYSMQRVLCPLSVTLVCQSECEVLLSQNLTEVCCVSAVTFTAELVASSQNDVRLV